VITSGARSGSTIGRIDLTFVSHLASVLAGV